MKTRVKNVGKKQAGGKNEGGEGGGTIITKPLKNANGSVLTLEKNHILVCNETLFRC